MPTEIELLDDLKLLLFAGGEDGDREIERHPERHSLHEGGERGALLAPLDYLWRVCATDDEVFRPTQRRHQREVLVDHAESKRRGSARRIDDLLAPLNHHLSRGWAVEAHHALDESRLAGAVLAEQRVKRAGRNFDRDVVERGEAAEPHGHADGFNLDGLVDRVFHFAQFRAAARRMSRNSTPRRTRRPAS